ncbi:MAG: DUF559 domain-containing protein [Propionibacteriaceae bacterium]|nr:DUF559 domain-containing protein [Propionibacteriaceae bacterium]
MSQWQAQRVKFLAHTGAVMTAVPDGVVLYGVTALQVLQVALPARLQDWERCHVLVPVGTCRPERPGVVAHSTRTAPTPWAIRDGLPVLHPVEHWLQLRGSDDELVEVADGLVRRKRPLIGMDDFRRRLDEMVGRPGVETGRRLLKLVVAGTDSIYETKTRLLMVHAGLPTPVVNHPVACRFGVVYLLDMAYVREKVAVEYDGADHVGNRTQMENDAQRRRDLQDEGWLIITVTAQDIAQPAAFLRSVEEALILRRAALR